MQKKTKLRFSAVTYATLAVLFIVFCVYMLVAEHNEVHTVRSESSYKTVTDALVKEIEDSSAPVGVRKQYSFTVENTNIDDASLIFYTVHQFAEVQLDGETVYSLTSGNKGIGVSPSSNWTVIPLYPSDSGQQVKVTVTPVYKSVINREVEFAVGSKYAFFAERLKIDLPQIVLSALCILMGVLLIVVQLIMILGKKPSSWDNFYLGNFSLLMGIWRITDTRLSSLMFANDAKALGYITIFTLFLLPVPLMLYLEELHAGKHRFLLRTAAITTGAAAFSAVMLQVLGIADLREMLVLCHIMLVIDIAISFFTVMFYAAESNKERNARLFVVLLTAGSIADLIYYYFKGTSSGMTAASIIFLICTGYEFVVNIIDITKKVYVDEKTKLFNKLCWDEFIEENVSDNETIGVMMIDLNNLKHTNDTLGHEVGDKLIVDFADILRNTVGSSEVLFRWGGDEFVVLVRNANKQKLADYVLEIHKAVDKHNRSDKGVSIHFACGFALSNDFPTLSKRELLAKADEFMYKDKQRWYDKYSYDLR